MTDHWKTTNFKNFELKRSLKNRCHYHQLLLSSRHLSDASICSTMAFHPLGNSDHVVVSVFIDFPLNSERDAPFHRIAYDYSCAD